MNKHFVMIFNFSKKQAFTLLEILCVIAVIGILSSILIPSINMARRSSLTAKSKAQFHQYIFALEAYHHEYGRYPYFFYEVDCVSLKEHGPEFVKALSGHGPHPEYRDLTNIEIQRLNPKQISFYHFNEWEFNEKGMLRDAFENPNIFISIDTDGKGILKIKDKPIAAKIAVYSQKSDGEGYQDIQSWR